MAESVWRVKGTDNLTSGGLPTIIASKMRSRPPRQHKLWTRSCFWSTANYAAKMLPLLFLLVSAAADDVADQLYQAGKFPEAVSAYQSLIRADPGSAEAWAGLGKSLLQMHDSKEAISCLSRALQLKPGQDETKIALARALLEAGNSGAAVGLLEPLYEQQPGNAQVLRLFSEGLYRGGYYQKTLQLVDELIAIHADDLAARNFRAVSLAKVGRSAQAEVACKRLMEEHPDSLDLDVALTYVEILYEDERIDSAMPYVVKVVEQQPRHPMARYWKARLLFRAGRLEEAAREAELSVSLAPGIPFARNLLLEIYRKTGRTQDAQLQAEWLREYNDRLAQRGR
jgi:predicted Zn-dependent protease